MSVLRRSVLLVAIAVLTVVASTAGPAQAAFVDRAAVAPITVGTVTVAAPTDVTAQMAFCNNSRSQYVQVTWQPSSTARVSGYTVAVHNSAGSTLATGQADPTTTSATVMIDKQYVNSSTLTFSVTTRTDYGWTAVSPRKAALPC